MATEVGFRPKQNISDSEKNKRWHEINIDYCISKMPFNSYIQQDKDLYDSYNGVRNLKKFEYLTKTFGIQFPAKLKRMPLITPLLKRLEGEQYKRGIKFTTFVTDQDSVNDKMREINASIFDSLMDRVLKSMQEREQQGLKQYLSDDELKKLEYHYKTNFRTNLEKKAYKVLKSGIEKSKLRDKFAESFKDRLIVGKEIIQVYLNRFGEDPRVEILNPLDVWYSGDESEQWIADCDWVVKRMFLSPTEIIDTYGEYMTSEEVNRVEDYVSLYAKSTAKIYDGSELSSEFIGTENAYKWACYYVEWKSIRAIPYLEMDNKYAKEYPFIKMLSYEDVVELPKGRREKLKYRYVQDLHSGIRIGTDIYVKCGKVKTAVRSWDKPSKVRLSINGKVSNTRSSKSYSLVRETEDVQDLYDILHFHKENLIALSGSKGLVMDISQIPKLSENNEENIKLFLYYKKLGTAFINRSQEGADKSFNQFQSYDDTLGVGLRVILETISHLEELAHRITGISRQAAGSVLQYDGKASTETAIIQSSYTTEPIFRDHYETMREILTSYLNCCRWSYRGGYRGQYIGNDGQNEIFEVGPEFSLSDYGVHVTNMFAEDQAKAKLEGVAIELAKNQILDPRVMLKFFKDISVNELEAEINSAFANKEEQANQLKQAEMQQAQQSSQGSSNLEAAKLQLEKDKLEFEKSYKQRELDIKERDSNRKLEVDSSYKDKQIELDKQRVELEKQQLIYDPKAAEIKNN